MNGMWNRNLNLILTTSRSIVQNLTLTQCAYVHTAPALLQSSIGNFCQKKFREEYFKKRDHIADDYKLVYKAPMELTVAACKHMANFSLATTTACIAIKYVYGIDIIDMSTEMDLGIGTLMSSGYELPLILTSFFIFNGVILYACSKYPLRIYRNNTSYVAMFEGRLPLDARPYAFSKGEVCETPNSILPWHESMYRMNKKSVLLLSNYFKTPSELHIMMQPEKQNTKRINKS